MDGPVSSPVDSLALGDLSLNVFDSPLKYSPSRCPSLLGNGSSVYSDHHLAWPSTEFQSKWSVPAWQNVDSLSFSSAPQTGASLNMLPPYGSVPPSKDDGSLFLPYIPMPELDCKQALHCSRPHTPHPLQFVPPVPPSPSDTCSSASTDFSSPLSYSPRPESLHVICNVPLLAPVPLPYHSPTFLQFDLPDVDEDLSHPPYTQRCPSSKRKRDFDDPANGDRVPQKRRSEDNTAKAVRPGYVSKRHTTPSAAKAKRIRQNLERH
jgi:hypothetical protein